MTVNEMSHLGLTAQQERIYRLCLRSSATGPEDVSDELGLTADAADQELSRLRELGLLVRHAEGLVAIDPGLALNRLTDLRLCELREEFEGLARVQRLVASLRAERATEIEEVTELFEIRDRIDQLASFACEEVALVEPGIPLDAEATDQTRPHLLSCLRRGISVRVVLSREAVEHPPTVAYLRELESHGARVRLVGHTTARVQMYDRRTAVVPVCPEGHAGGVLFARQRSLVSTVLALVQSLWAASKDLSALHGARSNEANGPSGQEWLALKAMCSGEKDEVGARNLGVSVRTYRRYMADLMQALCAGTRSQAALMARERGWI